MLRLTIVFLLLILTGVAFANRYAIVVGQNDGGKALRPLRYAEDDAKRFSEVLIELGGFQREDVLTILNADSSDINSALNKISKRLSKNEQQQNALVLIYYSGHADQDGLLLGKTRYSFEVLQKQISTLSSGVRIGIFDACQSGVVTAFKGGTRAEPFFFQNQQQVKGQVIIASSAANERAQESEALKGSVFSFHWLNGLRGSADVSADGKITLNEAYQYAYRKTVETSALSTGEIQHPVYRFAIQGQGDIILTNLEQAHGGLIFDYSCKGKFLVLSDNYLNVFADFYKDATSEQFISLASGRYTIIRADGKDIGTCEISLGENRKKRIKKSDFSAVTATQSRIKGYSSGSESEDSEVEPLSRFRWGVATGVMLDNVQTKRLERDGFLMLSGFYGINRQADVIFDLYGLFEKQNVGGRIGLDYAFNFEKGYISIGAGTGFEYHNSSSSYSDNRISPFLSLNSAFTAEITPRLQFQLFVPFTIVFDDYIMQRVGLGMRFLISGRYKNVAVMRSR